ncbi:MAG: RNA methyltransferase [Oscillospiraceae bacterium]|nr:RNA methyltransferase [Oscillospiraceae bacterium]
MNITSRQNDLIKQFKKPGESIVIEGVKLITDALDAGLSLQYLLFTEKNKNRLKIPGTVISDDLSEYISDTKTPQGIFAMFERRERHVDFKKAKRIILLDCVQEPGNVGAILRSCEAFGFDGVFLSENSADVYSPKVFRASAGSVLRLPIQKKPLTEIIPLLKKSGFFIYASALDENAVSLNQLDISEKTAVVIGNEGKGVSKEVLNLCDNKLYIPIKGAESLNAGVAAGIICYVLGKYKGM